MIALYCTVCGAHLYDRAVGFEVGEMISPVGMTRPDGKPVVHREPIHYCGCPSPEKDMPSLTTEPPHAA